MHITLKASLKNFGISIIVILAGVILTVIVSEFTRYSVREELKQLAPSEIAGDISKLPEMEFKKIEKAKTAFPAGSVSLKGFFPPARTDAPLPVDSKKANTTVDNLLFAMSFFYRVPPEKEINSSVVGWNPENGYYLPDEAYPEITLARNVRYLLALTIYQQLYPTTRYFDEDLSRMKAIVQKQLADENLNPLLEKTNLLQQLLPDNLFHDLLELSRITQDPIYRNAFLKVGKKLSGFTRAAATLIQSNRDRTDKINQFGQAAIGYIYGQETGNINLTGDAQILMDELIKELWADKFNLIYTNSTIGQFGNITETFITTNQMAALINIIRFAEASGDEELPEKIHGILKSMADGVNPLFDTQRLGFFRRYNGKSQTPQTDFKLAEDHIKYLEAWIRLNILKNGEYDMLLDGEYDGYEMLIYHDTNNAIYMTYETDWTPRAEQYGKPLVSADAILDFVLMTLEDRRFAAEKVTGG